MSEGKWAVGKGGSVTPYETGNAYPKISVFVEHGRVQVQFITDDRNGISDGNHSGVVTRDVEQGNSIERFARLVSIVGYEQNSNGTYTVAD